MDDIFGIFPKIHLNNMFTIFNNYHPELNFTFETEKYHSLNFLDVLVIFSYYKIIANKYQKTTYSERVFNYVSNHPFAHRKAMVL